MFKSLFKSQQEVITEIHNAFDTAQDRLLQEANKILSDPTIDAEIGERLKAIGFSSTPKAINASKLKSKIVSSREQASLINYYKQTYPFLKFLTESELDRICDKYALIYAPVFRYIKDVPEKNLRDIENAQNLKEQDYVGKLYRLIGNSHRGNYNEFLNRLGKSKPEFTVQEYETLLIKYYGESPWKIDQSTGWFVISREIGMKQTIAPTSFEVIDRSVLFIAAPKSHFNLNGLKKKSKHRFFSVLKTEVKDPIVFRYVRGGIQVITKWGLEASDPALLNEIDN